MNAVDNLVMVTWYEHGCDWITKYCDENHTRSALVPRKILDDPLANWIEED